MEELGRAGVVVDIYQLPDDLNAMLISLPDDAFNKMLEILKEKKVELVSEASNKHVASIVAHLILTVVPETRSIMKSVPQEIEEFLRNYIAHLDGKLDRPPVLDWTTALKYARLLMLPVEDRVLVLPSEEDIDRYAELSGEDGLESLNELVSETIAKIYLDTSLVSYDAQTKTISLVGRPIYRVDDELTFLSNLDKNKKPWHLWRLVKDAVETRVLSKISETLKLVDLRNTHGATTAVEKLGEVLGVDVPEELRGREVSVKPYIWLSNKELEIELKVQSEVLKDASHIMSFNIPLSELDNIRGHVSDAYRRMLKAVAEREKLLKTLVDLMEKHGFEVSTDADGNVYFTYKAGKSGSYEAMLTLYSTIRSGIADVEMKVEYKKSLDEPTFRKLLAERGYPVVDMTFYMGYESTDIRYKKSVASVEEARQLAEQLIALKDVVKEARREYLKATRKATGGRAPSKKTPEEAFALYLVLLYDPTSFRDNLAKVQEQVKELLSSTKSQRVKEVLKRGKENKYNPLIVHHEEIIADLVASGYIRILDSDIEVFGRSLAELLRGLGYSDSELQRIMERTRKGIIRSLATLEPSDLAKPVNGKPLWETLPEQAKKAYIEYMSPDKLISILLSSELMAVFSNDMNKVIERALEKGDLVVKTLVAYRFKPEIFGTRQRVDITSVGGAWALNAGAFLVHVYRVGDGYVDYIVYRKDKMIGILYRGRSLSEALAKALRTYDKAVEKAQWTMAQEKKIGSLVLPLDSLGRPVRGDNVSEEEVHEEAVH